MHPFQIEQLVADRHRDLLRTAERTQLVPNGRRLPMPFPTLIRRPRSSRPTTVRVPATGGVRCATC